MERERRKGVDPVPGDTNQFLTELQQMALRRFEGFGWHIKFIRRPLFQDPVTVIYSAEANQQGVLEEDGQLNLEPDIELRD